MLSLKKNGLFYSKRAEVLTIITREKSSECENAGGIHMVSSDYFPPKEYRCVKILWQQLQNNLENIEVLEILSFSTFQIGDEEFNYGYKLGIEMTSLSINMIKHLS